MIFKIIKTSRTLYDDMYIGKLITHSYDIYLYADRWIVIDKYGKTMSMKQMRQLDFYQ